MTTTLTSDQLISIIWQATIDATNRERERAGLAPLSDTTLSTLHRQHHKRLTGTARYLRDWLETSQPPYRHYQIAHAIHRAYTRYCIHAHHLTRAQCRTWSDETDDQRMLYLAAAKAVQLALKGVPQ